MVPPFRIHNEHAQFMIVVGWMDKKEKIMNEIIPYKLEMVFTTKIM